MAKLPIRTAPLDPRQEAFVKAFSETGDGYRAALDAGYAPGTAKQWRGTLLSSAHVAWAVAIETRKRIAEYAPYALATLKILIKEAPESRVRLEAAKTILAIGGYVAPRAIAERVTSEKPMHEMDSKELHELAARLQDELAGRARPVTSAPDALEDSQDTDLIE